jgi:hypothetical protein
VAVVARQPAAPPAPASRPDAGRLADTPTPAAVALGAGLAVPGPGGSIVFRPPAHEPVVQTAADPPAPAPAPAAPVPPTPPATTEVPSPAAPPATAPTGAPAAAHDDSQKLDQLAKQLYDNIRDRLKAELRLDRERWGRVTDLAR